jgi:hypothetical protein
MAGVALRLDERGAKGGLVSGAARSDGDREECWKEPAFGCAHAPSLPPPLVEIPRIRSRGSL